MCVKSFVSHEESLSVDTLLANGEIAGAIPSSRDVLIETNVAEFTYLGLEAGLIVGMAEQARLQTETRTKYAQVVVALRTMPEGVRN